MTARRPIPVLPILVLLILSLTALSSWGVSVSNVPTSVALVYPKQKIFKPGDWVLYKVYGQNISGEASIDYQRLLIGKTLRFRAEDCFWLETAWGPSPDSLVWSAALISEGLFQDENADIWPNFYLRMLHMETDADGVPRAAETRTVNPKTPLSDLLAEKPVYTPAGTETLQTPKGPIVCDVVEVTTTHRSARDMADSTLQQGTDSHIKRWMNIQAVPITGLVREEEVRTYVERTWPLGKPSTQFPFRVVGKDTYKIDMVDLGHGEKPHISDRIRSTSDRRGAPLDE